MTEIVTAVAGKVSEYMVDPIGRHLGYLFCYRSHIDELRNNVQKLGEARGDVQITVDEATRRGDEIRPRVQGWLKRVDEITGEAEELMLKDENNKISCYNLKSRYQLGRRASKKAQVIVEIQEARDFPDGVSYRLPPRTATFKEYEPFDSRASTLNKIMDALRDDKTKMIGVWGMGGVGKTTLVKQVVEQAKQEKLFATQVYVQVSWTREPEKFQQGILDIQQQIGGMLGLEFKNEAQSTKAAQLMQRLKKEKILIILDDIWKEVNLGEVGIPYCKDDDQKDCKILLASRDEDLLLQDMGAQECFPVQYLPSEEAWQLFKMTAGDSVENDHELLPTAREVVEECQGLPVAIVTTAKALKGKNMAVWKNALEELRSSEPTNIRGVEEKVYACLELSYNHLKSNALKSLFLLCGMLSYGDIWMDDLLSYAMGLDLFDRIKSLEEARNKLIALLTTLKTSSLLLEGDYRRRPFGGRRDSTLLFVDDDNKCVRMHDVVRDVARNIASKDPHRFVVREDDWSETNESKYISLYCKAVHELPQRLVCPKLQFLLLRSNLNINIPNTFFEGMNQLEVLDLSRMGFKTLPSTLQSLANLRTLCLDWCNKLRDIAGIGELKKLQVLSMTSSHIEQLPKEMGQLTNLRLLNLNYCWLLKVIPQNILSKLSKLECLFMRSSFSKWEVAEVSDGKSNNACLPELNHLDHLRTIEIEIPDVEMVPEKDTEVSNGESNNVCPSELNHLEHLRTIEIDIPDVKMAPEKDMFFQNLTSCVIRIGFFDDFEKNFERSKILRLKGVSGSLLLRNGMRKLLEKIEELELSNLYGAKGLFSPPVLVNFHNLKCLSISYYEGNVNGVLFGEQVSFPNLEKLKLKRLSMLKTIWHPQLSLKSLDKLQILKVYTCPCLVDLFPSHLMQSLQNLKEVVVDDCEVLERVFGHGESNGENRIFLKMEILKLRELPKLKHLFNTQGNNDMRYFLSKFKDFHHMRELRISNCGMPLDEKVSFSSNLEVLVLERFPKLNQIDFENPQQLRILLLTKLPKLSSIVRYKDGNASKICRLSPSMSEIFHSLKHLRIIDCKMENRRDLRTPANGIVLSNEKVPFFDGVSNYEAFQSRVPIFDKIMDALRDDDINCIGVVGIGGVGKTTLVKQVAHQAMQEKLFTTQVYIDLSSMTGHSDELGEEVISEIQEKIVDMLGWKSKDCHIAVELKKRLKREKILIILDDIWKEIHDLEEIGIPSCKDDDDDENECKIVLTCRDGDGEQLCEDMGAQICFQVDTLRPEEAWTLFQKTALGADSVVEKIPKVRSIARQVVEECEGLPISIVTNAKALKDETQLAVWKNALEELKSCAVGKKVYSGCLGKGDHFKSLLLLCGMLDNGDISIDHLLQYAIGLDLFERIDKLEQAKERLLEFVEILKDDHRPKDRHNFVRMHHVVYDVVCEIASKDPRSFVFREEVVRLEEWSESDESKSCTFISLQYFKDFHELPQTLVCPELQFFLLRGNPSLNIPNTFFQGMKKLQVLDLSLMSFEELPSSLYSLSNLRTLCLDKCCRLVNIAGIGKLTKLEVLNLVNTAIQQLPDDMSQLTNLRLLDLSDSKELEGIPLNVISSLSKLECLFMITRFPKWEVDHQSNAYLSQLKHLSCLTTLHIGIPYVKLLPEDIQFENLTRYAIHIGDCWQELRRTDRTLKLKKVNISLFLGDEIRKLLERSEELELEELSGTKHVLQYPSDGESFLELKHLKVIRSPEIQYIIDSVDQHTFLQHSAPFPLLESLVLRSLISLQEVWHERSIPRGSFGNLKTLEVESCRELRYFFSLSTARGLSQLENMKIKKCNAMEQIISYEKESGDEYGGTNLELFPNLRTLELGNLPKLINFIPELDTNSRPKDSSFNHKVILFKLEKLKLYGVPKLKNVWNPEGPFGSLPNLQTLWVWPDF